MSETTNTTEESKLSVGLIITIIRDVLKQWYLIAVVSLIAGMCMYVFTDFTYVPQYSCSTTFVVTAAGANTTTFSNLNAASTSASVFSEVLNSNLLQSKVLEKMGVGRFNGTVTTTAVSGTNLMTMTVKGKDPRSVFLMSKAMIKHHEIVTGDALGNTILEVLREPTVPNGPINRPNVNSRVKKTVVYTGAALAVLLAGMSYMADKVRTKEEADEKLRCRVLGELYHERKRKTLRDWLRRKSKSILITDPLTTFGYVEAVHKLSTRVDKRRHKGEKTIMVTSLRENEGKSTVAVNLALSFASKGKKVLLIDLDLRKPAVALVLDRTVNNEQTVIEALAGKQTMDDCTQFVENGGLYVLPARRSLKAATKLLNSAEMDRLLEEAQEKYDLVILDTPPMAVAPDAELIADHVGGAIMVVKQNEASSEEINEATAVLEKSCPHLLGCVLNNVYGTRNFVPVYRYGSYGSYGYGYGYGYKKYGYGKGGYGKHGYGRSAYSRRSNGYGRTHSNEEKQS